MKNIYSSFWGIDVSKNWLDISINQEVVRIDQTKKAITDFLKKNIKKSAATATLVVLESTGGYERLAVDCLAQANVIVHVSHPNRVRDFAKAKGRLAKSDKLDAKVLEDYGRFIDPAHIRPLPSKLTRELSDLNSALAQLKEMHHQEACRLGLVKCQVIEKAHRRIQEALEKQIKAIQQHMLKLIQSDEQLTEKYNRLQTMKGVGSAVALSLVADLPELGKANKKEIAALVGVAPITKESGKQKGKAMTQNGRSAVRKMLYMGALVAVRHDQKMKTFYEKLVSKGKPKKVALVAVMRKMLVIMNAMILRQENYRQPA